MANEAISTGALEAIFTDENRAAREFPVPILQCLQIKPMGAGAQGGDRYRLVMSDGQHFVQAILATGANSVIYENKLEVRCFARIKEYSTKALNNRQIMIILNLEVVESMGVAPTKIGNPVSIDSLRPSEAAPADTAIKGEDFYGVKEEPTTQPKQMMPSRPAASANSAIYPIEGLSFVLSKWKIKARVTFKSEIKRWHKATQGKLFSVHLLDESGEIKATGFNDQVDAFYDVLQEGQVYYISTPCKVSPAKKQFNNLPHEFELIFDNGTQIEKAEDQTSVPQVKFNFCTIGDLQNVEPDNTVDVLGVLKEVGEVNEINSKKDGRSFSKRDLTLVDETGYSVRLTIWGKTADSFDVQPESVIAFKGTKVSDFGGKSLSLLSSGTMSIHPDIPEAHKLKGWYEAAGRGNEFATHRNTGGMGGATGRNYEVKTLAEIKDVDLSDGAEAYYSVKASIIYTRRENFAYPSCPKCNKKVSDMGDGTWLCEKDNLPLEKPEYRYIMSLNVADHTDQQWLNCFDEVGKNTIGMSANELTELKKNDDPRAEDAFLGIMYKKFNFKCRAKMDTYGDTPRVRYQILEAAPIDFKAEGNALAELIKKYEISS